MFQSTYLLPGPVMSAHPVVVQNSLMVPYTRLTFSKSANAKNERKILWLKDVGVKLFSNLVIFKFSN